MAFDPDAYLAKKETGGFDPDAYLASKGKPLGATEPTKSDPSLLDKIVEMGKGGIGPALGGAIGRSTGLGMAGELAGRYYGANPKDLPKAAPAAMMVAMPEIAGAAGVSAGLAPATNALFRMSAGAVGGMAGEGIKQTALPEGGSLDAIATMGQSGEAGALSEAAALAAGPIAEKAAPYLKKGGKAVAKGYGKVAEFFGGVTSSDIVRLADDPAAVLPEIMGGSKSTDKAGKAFGKTVEKSGFLPKAATEGEGLGKFAGRESPFKASDAVANKYYERIASGQKLTPPELYDAYQSAQESVSKMSRWNPRKIEMLDFKNALQTELQSLSGEYAQASQDFARAAVGRSTSNLLPRTATGKVSLGRTGFANLVAPGIGTVLSSPAFYGGTTAAVSGAAKGLAAVVGNPTARRVAFSEIVKRARSKKK